MASMVVRAAIAAAKNKKTPVFISDTQIGTAARITPADRKASFSQRRRQHRLAQ
jgi:hypothetical protein